MKSVAFKIRVLPICSLLLAACSARQAGEDVVGDVRITIEQAESGPWRVAYEFAQPQPEVDFGVDLGGYRAANWRIEGREASLIHRDHHDFIAPIGDRRRFKTVEILVEPATIDTYKNYDPFTPMGDGGVLFYTGHFMPFTKSGDRMQARLTIVAAAGAQVSAFGESGARIENWESPYQHPAFIYVGTTTPLESDALLTITDQTAPAWISDEVSTFAPAIGAALQSLLQRALPTKPNIFVAMGDLSEAGRLNYSGDALPGQYQMTLTGGAWRESSAQALAVLRQATAHEAAHLWQAATRPKSASVPDWIHEGGADALAAEAMLKAGYWTAEEAQSAENEARSRCSASLERLSLQRAENDERWDAVYACGHILNVAAAGEAGVSAFWREFVRRTAAEGYDEAAFLALAGELAGEETADEIRKLVRFNEARPDLAISRMLK